MDVFVVSRSRWERSDTLESLGELARDVTLVVPEAQRNNYLPLSKRHGCKLRGCPYEGISKTRQYCGQVALGWRFLMLDDDLTFFRRVSASDWHLKLPHEVGDTAESMLNLISDSLRKYVHVAVSAREGNNRLPYEGLENARPLRALAYRKREFLEVEHGRVKIMEDFDVSLQLIKKGYKNLVISQWTHSQRQTQMAGGCSDYRTKELHAAEVEKFASLHPGLVKLRQKVNKTGGDFGHRLEATIYWQKAYRQTKETL